MTSSNSFIDQWIATHADFATNLKDWSLDALPGSIPGTYPWGIFTQGTMTLNNPSLQLHLQMSGSDPSLVMSGNNLDANASLWGGTATIQTAGAHNTLNLSDMAPNTYTKALVNVGGTLSGTWSISNSMVDVRGPANLSAKLNVSGNHYGAGTVELDASDQGTTISVNLGGTLTLDRLQFLQQSSSVTLNDDWNPKIPVPPSIEDQGATPTLEIKGLSTLQNAVWTSDLTLDFTNGSRVSLPNLHIADPQFYAAVQAPNGTLTLSEGIAPAAGTGSHVFHL
jgi:hypothetical protein